MKIEIETDEKEDKLFERFNNGFERTFVGLVKVFDKYFPAILVIAFNLLILTLVLNTVYNLAGDKSARFCYIMDSKQNNVEPEHSQFVLVVNRGWGVERKVATFNSSREAMDLAGQMNCPIK